MPEDLSWNTGHGTVILHRGDITRLDVDAVVNAANKALAGGGGVDGAIHRAGGPAIMEECRRIIAEIGKLETGKAVITTAGNMQARHVIHTVGPIYNASRGATGAPDFSNPSHASLTNAVAPGQDGTPLGCGAEQAVQLADCYRSSMALAARKGLKSIAFSSISTGVYGYPVPAAAKTATETVRDELAAGSSVERAIFCVFSEEDREVYRAQLVALFGEP